MRPIDADALTQTIVDTKLSPAYNKVKVMNAIAKAPTVDAVPVVRCKECEYWDDFECYDGRIIKICRLDDKQSKPDDFCSHGERREDSNSET